MSLTSPALPPLPTLPWPEPPLLELQHVAKVYRTATLETVALSDVNLRIARGESVAVMGPSGCGKSTLLSLLGLLDAPTQGRVLLAGRPVQDYPDRELAALRNRQLGFIFQSYQLINDLSVRDNVELPLLYRPGVAGAERRRRALAALDQVGLSARPDHFPAQLSGGQRQRVAIARALVGEPALLLADEPTGNLDSARSAEILELLLSFTRERGTTLVLVTHDEQQARQAGRLIRFFDGRQVA